MGLTCGANALYSIYGLTISDVFDICIGIAAEWGMDSTPIIDIDGSNVHFKVGKTVSGVASLLIKWADAGFLTVPVCNAKVRAISKQAKNICKADKDKT